MNFRTARREELELNITPLIDIVFLLLIFFMVSTTFQKESQLRVQLPEATQQPRADPSEPLEIVISAQGQYAIGGRELSDNSLATVIEALRQAAGDRRERPLVVRADARTPHQAVVRAMDAAARLGLRNLSIATAREPGGG
ncbi:MAG: biopolymer transporter ExbD [Halofilum sp. (in: g-proteobacteria)]|nr:biopolymer transporter ExbD [Halofilum sp. (in: g-proteobacteria)]